VIKSVANELPKVFYVTHVAQSFKEVAIDVVRGETTEFLSRWYQSARGDADLSIWWDSEKRVVKQQLCLFGQVVEWNPIHGTRTGLVVEHESAAANPRSPDDARDDADESTDDKTSDDTTSEIIHFDPKAQRNPIDQAIALIREVSAISTEDRALLVYNFRESPKLHKNARERAIKAWAPQSEELLASARSSFWKRVGGWVFGK
jgi:hypothetical protein